MSTKITEDQLQAQCVTWFRMQYPGKIIYAIPNGGSRNKIEAAKLKKCGVLAGVPDLFIADIKYKYIGTKIQTIDESPDYCATVLKKFVYPGLYIEIKSKTGKISKEQKEILIRLSKAGYPYAVCYTFDGFIKVVKEYFGD